MFARGMFLAMAAFALLLAGSPPAAAQKPAPVAVSYTPAVTRHKVNLAGRTVPYTATAGLMPIYNDDGSRLLADMSYVAYTMRGAGQAQRPVAFLWNGGPGANTLPLHYGAFGPRRFEGGALEPNEATLLDVADLVFIDAMETGFSRVALGVEPRSMLNAKSDMRAFARFIETWRKKNKADAQPVFLIGESYGVLRAMLVADELDSRGVEVEGAVLISGSSLVFPFLGEEVGGALRIPGYSALAFEQERLDRSVGATAMEVHNTALAWIGRTLATSYSEENFMSGWETFAKELSPFIGTPAADILASKLPIGSSGIRHALRTVAKRGTGALGLTQGDQYDMRQPHGAFDRHWISQVLVDDLRKTLGNNPTRQYFGLESSVPGGSGLASHVVNRGGYWRVPWFNADALPSDLMKEAPRFDVFFAGGIFDNMFPCAHTIEQVKRDLAAFRDRTKLECYAGGHMMYFEEAVGAQLSADVREFIRIAR